MLPARTDDPDLEEQLMHAGIMRESIGRMSRWDWGLGRLGKRRAGASRHTNS